MKTKNNSFSKFKEYKHHFDKITSQNSKNWQLAFFWIICIEIFASIFEYEFLSNSATNVTLIPSGIGKDLIVSFFVVTFVAGCIYNIIFYSRKSIMILLLLGFLCAYLFITSDFTLSFLFHNIEPLHFFNIDFSFALFFELFLKLVITYLIYQLIASIRKKSNN